MENLKNNKKGFTLVELVIVIAILGVLASVSINMFSGLVIRAREKADEIQANNIGRAIAAYIAETGNVSLDELMKAGAENSIPTLSRGEQIILGLQVIVEEYGVGPYLDPKGGASVENYKPQEDGKNGWSITLDASTGAINVESATTYSYNGL